MTIGDSRKRCPGVDRCDRIKPILDQNITDSQAAEEILKAYQECGDFRVPPATADKPWSVTKAIHEEACGHCSGLIDCQDDNCPLLIAKLRAFYEAMEEAGAIKHAVVCDICGGFDFEKKGCSVCGYGEGECKRDCPACAIEKQLWPEGRG
jgi:ribosomal protein L37E